MGILKAVIASVESSFGNQWKELFYCEALPDTTLIVRGKKYVSGSAENTRGNTIRDGSIICCADGQCALVIENGKIIEAFETPGEHIFHNESAPTIFGKSGIKGVMKDIRNRVGFGGDAPPVSQRVYYLNTKECYGTSFSYEGRNAIRLVDEERGLDIDCSISCSGMFSYKITDPVQFYKNVSGNVVHAYTRSKLSDQMRQEFLSALQPAFSLLSEKRIRAYEFPAHTEDLSEAMRTVMSNCWSCLRGIEVVTITFSTLNVTTYDGKILAEVQKTAALQSPLQQTAHLVGAQVDAVKNAAHNNIGTEIVSTANGENTANTEDHEATYTWTCNCGNITSGRFCTECGAQRPVRWTCSCGTVTTTKFCPECGKPRCGT